jgi:guanylate cyclase
MDAVPRQNASILSRFLNRFTLAFSEPDDAEELRLQKATAAVANLMFVPAGIIWGVVYIVLGDLRSGLIPLGYGIVCILSLSLWYVTRRYEFFRDSQLLFVLVLPALLMISLGGFIPSSAVIVWSFVSPMGALMLAGRRQAFRWLLLYLVVLALVGVIDRGVRAPDPLPNGVMVLFFVLNIAAVSGIVFTLLAYFDSEKDRVHGLLRAEQATSERLLINVLPKEIVPALKQGRAAAEHFDSASILFADIVGFTSLSAQLTPGEMVDLLNEIFSHFDTLVARYGLEKIRTIGDNYMVVSGVPTPRPDHAVALADMALDICRYLDQKPWGRGVDLSFRLGMSSGPMVGAVIGQTKFHYDVWGQAVNMASRMETLGVPGKIQITPDAHELLKDSFECERRGVIDVKGAGEMETWFLVGRRR